MEAPQPKAVPDPMPGYGRIKTVGGWPDQPLIRSTSTSPYTITSSNTSNAIYSNAAAVLND